ncbi:fimbrial protein [Dryocola clanedunensis]
MRKLFIPVSMFLMSSAAVFAADPVNINITGKVVASPCVVNSGSGDLTMDLGQNIQASTLATAGSGSTPVTQDLKLTSCPVGTTNVKATFTGTADTTSTTMYKNTGTATPLAVELSNAEDSSLLSNGTTLTLPVLADNTVTFKLKARAYTAAGSVTPGTISSVVVADFTYQ